MDKTIIIEKLVSLARLDYDLMCAYEEAIKRTSKNDHDVRESLALYRNDHALHLNVLSTAIADLGGQVPPLSPKARGRATEGITPMAGTRGTARALEALRQNEALINKQYAEAISDPGFSGYPMDIQEHLKNNHHDEEHHLSFIEETLSALAAPAG